MSVAWVGAGIATVGLISSSNSAGDASDAQNNATAASSSASAAELAWAKEQQASWDEIFGPTQKLLGEYYNTLDADSFAANRVGEIQKGYQDYQKQLDQQFAQRGMSGSGLEAESLSQGLYMNAQAKAQARFDAPRNVAEQQYGFLQLGLNQAQGLNQNITGAYSNQANTLSQQSLAASQQLSQANSSLASSFGTLGTTLGSMYTPTPVATTPTTAYTQYDGGATWG